MSTPGSDPGWLDRLSGLLRKASGLGRGGAAPLDGPAGGVGKRALRETIERKRRNDLARRQELDRLRLTLRQAPGASLADSLEAPGFEHSSPLPDLQAQSRTIEKIDAVEAQLSRQWWRGRVGGGAVEVRRTTLPMAAAGPPATQDQLAYATTQLIHPGQSVDPPADSTSAGFAATQWLGAAPAPLAPGETGVLPRRADVPLSAAVAAERPAPVAKPSGTDPWSSPLDAVLEEASLRFANGDDVGAQACLATALARAAGTAADPRWGLALLDLFRLTGQQALFEAALPDHVQRFAGVAPRWFSVPEGASAGPIDARSGDRAQTGVPAAAWACPARLTGDDVAQLQAALASAASPWRLDWVRLDTIASDALGPLQALLAQWCAEPLALCFYGSECLEAALQALTPSGDASQPLAGWQLRLTALRLLGQRDAFELVALDCGVTHGMAPPLWADAHCQLTRQLTRVGLTGRQPQRLASATRDGHVAVAGPALALNGELRGERPATLAALAAVPAGAEALVVACHGLVRLDFSAAGRLLTWVTACREAGRKVRFEDVPPLVAAFFQVIGIDEHAELAVRTH